MYGIRKELGVTVGQCILILCIVCLANCQTTNSFAQEPVDTTVVQGRDVILYCVLRDANPGQSVLWTKGSNNVPLGTDRDLPAYPRYSIIGESNLRIEEAQLEDDDVYQCHSTNLRSNKATLTVQVPPQPPSLDGYSNGTTIRVEPPSTITLTCRANNGRPEAIIIWLKDDEPIHDGTLLESVEDAGDPLGKMTNTVSTLTFELGLTDNGAVYKCIVKHPAQSLRYIVSLTIDVHYPPQRPFISGYEEDSKVTAGNLLHLTCVAVGGNPRATLTWTKNGAPLQGDYSVCSKLATNELSLILEQTDNKANYICSASNEATPTPLVTQMSVDVLFPPERVTMTAEPMEYQEGDRVVIICRTTSSNSASQLTWWKDGLQIQGSDVVVEASDNGGFSTSSQLILESVSSDENGHIFLCRAQNEVSVEPVSDGLVLNVRPAMGEVNIEDEICSALQYIPGVGTLYRVSPIFIRSLQDKAMNGSQAALAIIHADMKEIFYFRDLVQPEDDVTVHSLSDSSLLIDVSATHKRLKHVVQRYVQDGISQFLLVHHNESGDFHRLFLDNRVRMAKLGLTTGALYLGLLTYNPYASNSMIAVIAPNGFKKDNPILVNWKFDRLWNGTRDYIVRSVGTFGKCEFDSEDPAGQFVEIEILRDEIYYWFTGSVYLGDLVKSDDMVEYGLRGSYIELDMHSLNPDQSLGTITRLNMQ